MHFTDDIPQTSQIAMPIVVLPTYFTNSISQLRDAIDQIKLEQLSTLDSIDELKAAFSGKITNLEIAFAQTNTRQDLIFRMEMHALRQEIEIQKWEESNRGPPDDRADLVKVAVEVNYQASCSQQSKIIQTHTEAIKKRIKFFSFGLTV
ncbi:hypothetical protein F511_02718 [Dorcoceras hygrometricum]|uniref:Uncharacterized protein n=1 Tax=Dorcoceras hygrometricum TaxID=472368 RepID=A0A2Z7A849_9LAMI|nr:hypothetical protein F511_02718 [Dorcoceras hygrometricum]